MESNLYKTTQSWIHRHFDQVGGPLTALHSGVLEELLNFMMDQRKLGSRSLTTENVERFLVPSLTDLNLSDFWVSDLNFAVAGGCPNLRVVNFSNCLHIKDATLLYLGRNCPHLATLRLSGCPHVTTEGVNAVAEGCQDLSQIELDATSVDDAGISALLRHLKLTELQLFRCKNLSFYLLSSDFLAARTLRTVHLNQMALTDGQICALEGVETLSLSDCVGPQRLDLSRFVNLCTLRFNAIFSLRDLRLPNTENLSVVELVRCTHLRNLEFLESFMPHAKRLMVKATKTISPKEIYRLCNDLPRATQLTHLEISEMQTVKRGGSKPVNGPRIQVTCPTLTRFDWRDVFRLEMPTPKIAVVGLTRVELFNSPVLDAELQEIAMACPQIEHLDLEECTELRDAATDIISHHLPGLVHLNLAKCVMKRPNLRLLRLRALILPDMRASGMTFECPELVVLDISGHGNDFLSSLSASLAVSGGKLEKLWARHSHITEDTLLQSIKRHCPNLKIMDWTHSRLFSLDLLTDIVAALPRYQLGKLYLGAALPEPDERMLQVAAEHCTDLVWKKSGKGE